MSPGGRECRRADVSLRDPQSAGTFCAKMSPEERDVPSMVSATPGSRQSTRRDSRRRRGQAAHLGHCLTSRDASEAARVFGGPTFGQPRPRGVEERSASQDGRGPRPQHRMTRRFGSSTRVARRGRGSSEYHQGCCEARPGWYVLVATKPCRRRLASTVAIIAPSRGGDAARLCTVHANLTLSPAGGGAILVAARPAFRRDGPLTSVSPERPTSPGPLTQRSESLDKRAAVCYSMFSIVSNVHYPKRTCHVASSMTQGVSPSQRGSG